LVPVTRIFLATPTRGATAVNNTTTSKQLGRKMEARVSGKKIFGSLRCKNQGVIIPLQKSKSTDIASTLSIIGITERGGKTTTGRKVYTS
jgi:hypothetical protein